MVRRQPRFITLSNSISSPYLSTRMSRKQAILEDFIDRMYTHTYTHIHTYIHTPSTNAHVNHWFVLMCVHRGGDGYNK